MKSAVFDLEADGLLDTVTQVWCAVVKDIDTGHVEEFTPKDINMLGDYLSKYDILIGHNCIGYDFPVLNRIFGYKYCGVVVDTLLISRSQNLSRKSPPNYTGRAPHSVEAWGCRLGIAKQEHEDWSQFSFDMLGRCEQDVHIQHRIYDTLMKEGEGHGWGAAHKLNSKIFQYLQQQEERGWTIDVSHLNNCTATLERWIDRINRALIPHLPYIVDVLETKTQGSYNYVKKPFKQDGTLTKVTSEYATSNGINVHAISGPYTRINFRLVNLDSTVEVKDFLLSQGWQPEKWNEKNGQRTSANLSKDDSFNGVQGSLGRLVVKRIQCRQRKSVLVGWGAGIGNNGRIATGVAGIATTGRLRHKVIVNVPSPASGAFFAKQMRQCFIAQKGWVMVGVDSKGNQMRHLAARMQDKEFTDAVLYGNQKDGTDLHSLNQRRSGAATRTLAKNFFYGAVLFGAGDTKTGKILGTGTKEAKKIKEDYFKEMPGLTKVIEGLKKQWRVTAKRRWNERFRRQEYYEGYIHGLDGRPIMVPYEKDLLCYALQSDEAIHMGVAYVMLHKWAEQRGWGRSDWNMLIWMHDEFQMESKPEIGKELGILGCRAIEWAANYLKVNCPHDGDYLIGESWYNTH